MDREMRKAVKGLYVEAFQDSLRISTDALRYILTVSVSLLTLLLPLLIFVAERTQSRDLLLWVVGSLLLSSLVSLSGLIIYVYKFRQRWKIARQIEAYVRGEGKFPGTEWESPHTTLAGCAIIAGMCFGSAFVSLCAVLFQILFS